MKEFVAFIMAEVRNGEIMRKSIPWIKIKSLYLSGVTPSDLAKKYRVKAKTIQEKASRDNWPQEKLRISNNVAQRVEEKLIEDVLDQTAQIYQLNQLAINALKEYFENKDYKKFIVNELEEATDSSGKPILKENGKPLKKKVAHVLESPIPLADNLVIAVKALAQLNQIARLAEGKSTEKIDLSTNRKLEDYFLDEFDSNNTET